MIKLTAIADDLTGANDTALQFAKRNIKSSVKINFRNAENTISDVIIVDSDSRDLTAQESYCKVSELSKLLQPYDSICIYKKMDSTLRGNIGAEIQAMADVYNPDIVIIAPAYPTNQRTTIGGYHMMQGKPLELTEIANSPKTPVHDSYIPDILNKQVCNTNIGILKFNVISHGRDAVFAKLTELVENDKTWIVCDILEEEHFIIILDAVRRLGLQKILWAGSAGLADYIPYYYEWQGEYVQEISNRNGAVLICAGSVSHTTQLQVRHLKQHADIQTIQIEGSRLLLEADAIKEYADKIMVYISQGYDVMIYSAETDADVKKTVETGRNLGLNNKEVSEIIAGKLSMIINLLELESFAGIVITGGDIAIHICRSIGVDDIEIVKEVEPGVPLGIMRGEKVPPLLIVTKAGAFGKEDVFIKALDMIKNNK